MNKIKLNEKYCINHLNVSCDGLHDKDLSTYAKDPFNAPYPPELKKDIAELIKFKNIASKMNREVHPGPHVKGWSEYEKRLQDYPALYRRIAMGLSKFYSGDLKSSNKASIAILGRVK